MSTSIKLAPSNLPRGRSVAGLCQLCGHGGGHLGVVGLHSLGCEEIGVSVEGIQDLGHVVEGGVEASLVSVPVHLGGGCLVVAPLTWYLTPSGPM